MGQRGQGESQGSGGGATPLVDQTVKLLEESVFEEKKPLPPPTSTSMRQVSRDKVKEEEEKKVGECVDSFMRTYVSDAMKYEKRSDYMRVSFLVPLCLPVVNHAGNIYRVAVKNMRRNSWASALIPSMENCSHCSLLLVHFSFWVECIRVLVYPLYH